MIVGLFLILAIYIGLILNLSIAFDKVKPFTNDSETARTTFSIVIPFRNEADNLNALLRSLANQNYPKELFEIILVDDDSQDESIKIINTFSTTYHSQTNHLNLNLLNNKRLSDSPKKDAITTAIAIAKNAWIVTTDADCIAQNEWLTTIDSFINQHHPKMIVAPVNFHSVDSFFNNFQWLDVMSLQASTIAGFGLNKPFLCNGANLAYEKELFNELNGFKNNDTIASGDDIFFLETTLKKYPTHISYLKDINATVYTKPESNLSNLFHQHVRWAGKTSAYNNAFGKWVGFIILLMNASVICAIALGITQLIPVGYMLLIVWLKAMTDVLLIKKAVRFHNQYICWKYYILSSLLYPFFTVSVVVYAMLFRYKWKGRRFKK